MLLFHLWPNRLSGGYVGVDVFFVISGFLITSHLVTSRPSSGRDLATFWMRRVRRLLPAALLVLAATLVASRLFAPDTLWKNTALESIASALYVQNWRLADQAVDYLAADNAPTPVQHYWSLSVEEQFYAVWPLLVLVCVLVARRFARRLDSVVLVVLSVVVAGSLWYSVTATDADPARAYFVTPTRVWELGIGGLLAAAVIRAGSRDDGVTDPWRLPPVLRSGLAWLGFAAIAWSAYTYTGATPFPGTAALVPVLGTAAVIAAHAQGTGSPTQLLSWRPVQWLGDVSYSVYLWHWPLIVILPHVSGSLGRLDKATIIVASLVLAGLSKTFVEDRFRRQPRGVPLRRPFLVAAVGMALVVGAGTAQAAEVDHRNEVARAQIEKALRDPCFGAPTMAPGSTCPRPNDGLVVPSTSLAGSDKSDAYDDDCWVYRPFSEFRTCEYGDRDSDVRIALVGNSHAGHWLPALQAIAEKHHWRITTFLVSQCYPTTVELELETRKFSRNCLEWGRKALQATTTGDFDLVIESNRTGIRPRGSNRDTLVEAAKQGYDAYLKEWLDRGVNLLVIRDDPLPLATIGSPPDCVAKHQGDFDKCSAPRSAWVRPDPLVEAARDTGSSNVSVADLTDYFCDDRCYSVIGRAMVYFDATHITATYARTLAPYLEPYVVQAVERAR